MIDRFKQGTGKAPAVALMNPKYGHNVSGTLRACSAFGVGQLWFTGTRVVEEWEKQGRLPREERMKAYNDVDVFWEERFFDAFAGDIIPVAVEVMDSAEPLTTFEHPEQALYVFGPEDGGLGKVARMHCYRHVIIPSDHCLNLATAVTLVLGHRRMQRQMTGLEPVRPSYETIQEHRGFINDDSPWMWGV
jgi:tRNA(Leu) C34 or U34 (ribose-2'-O)-methylase TrmL